jgi:hypothetical protein
MTGVDFASKPVVVQACSTDFRTGAAVGGTAGVVGGADGDG